MLSASTQKLTQLTGELASLRSRQQSLRADRVAVLDRYYHLRQFSPSGRVAPDLEAQAQKIESECGVEYEQRERLIREIFEAKTSVLIDIADHYSGLAAKDSRGLLACRFKKYWKMACDHRFKIDGIYCVEIDIDGPMFKTFAKAFGYRTGKAFLLAINAH